MISNVSNIVFARFDVLHLQSILQSVLNQMKKEKFENTVMAVAPPNLVIRCAPFAFVAPRPRTSLTMFCFHQRNKAEGPGDWRNGR